MVIPRPLTSVLAVALAASACRNDFSLTLSRVTGPRLLAVRAEPAEVAPGSRSALTALWVDERGDALTTGIEWWFCNERKPLRELGPVSPRCAAGDAALEPIGLGLAVNGAVPADACRLFGPDVPESTAEEPAGRPVDPDPTGGYYQPLRIATGAGPAVDRLRLACGLAGATLEQLVSYRARYRMNVNPTIASLRVIDGPELAPRERGANRVRRGERLALRVAWPTCSEASCAGAEPYVALDPATRTLADRREAMRVSWFATGGDFGDERTGRQEGDTTTTSDNVWTAPDQSGTVTMWLVLRDSRGGAGWATYAVTVD